MRAPSFWDHDKGRGEGRIWALLLAPAGWLYGACVRLHLALTRPVTAGLPIICVGNFVAGGAGKTPAALAIARLIAAEGGNPGFLSRGHGGRLAGPVRVDPARHDASDVGDEPLLLAQAFPTIVARRRPAGAALAADLGLSHLILDDGLQDRSLIKDLTLAVVDAGQGLGNGRVMPAGPLRAPPAFQARLADAIILVGDGPRAGRIRAFAARHGLPLMAAHVRPDAEDAAHLHGRAVVAFAGIGRPEKFFRTVEEAGARIAARRGFADHHPFSEADARGLLALGERHGGLLVTTQKDMARLKGLEGARGALARAAFALPVTMRMDDGDVLRALIEDKCVGKS